MTNQKTIILWEKKGCSYCQEVKDYLAQRKLPYKSIDVTENDAFRNILDVKYGVRYVPVVEIGEGLNYEAVIEIGIEHLENALRNNKFEVV